MYLMPDGFLKWLQTKYCVYFPEALIQVLDEDKMFLDEWVVGTPIPPWLYEEWYEDTVL